MEEKNIKKQLAMIPVLLTKVVTADNVDLEGIYVEPSKKSSTALVYVHGLGSSFSRGQDFAGELAERCRKEGIGYFKFNTRGSDVVSGFEEPLLGKAFEKFEDCVLDIAAVLQFAKKLGYKKIILAGHSTGANKVLYYLYKTGDRAIVGLALLGPVSDVVCAEKIYGKKILEKGLAAAKRLREKNPSLLMSRRYGLISAGRFWSLYHPGESEDVFPYYNVKAKWKELGSIKVPVCVVVGSKDEYLDRSAKEVVDIFRSRAKVAKSFEGVVIKDAVHGFVGRERRLTRVVADWIVNSIKS